MITKQARHNEILIRVGLGLKQVANESNENGVPGARSRGKFFMATRFRSLEKAPFWKICH